MKYKLLKDLPLAKVGTKVELKDDGIHYAIMADEMIDFVTLGYILSKDIPEWLEEVKEPKTIYDLKKGDHYYCLDDENDIELYNVATSRTPYFNEKNIIGCFLTEREAKRNKLLRELATRQGKWLPEKGDQYYSYHLAGCDGWSWQGDNTDMIKYHSGLVFRNEEEYSRWMTEDNKKLLFNI